MSFEYVPWGRISHGRLLHIADDRAWVTPPPPTLTACEHLNNFFTGYGFARTPERYVNVCADCFVVLGAPIIRG